ncbi:MAG TPA: alpha/beta hydrolase [Phenylobacterium sp.]|uniref:alpha/beta hydrolase n=1 Tax=Phenylobacterium sp. TaxID=1871053 RepID=UPI002D44C5C3|nr:alpha/beta hydrolase [Phenylobacterium sp.]HZZ70448.1 alpha/beta hydrolase [Phenylobacterium sp.]
MELRQTYQTPFGEVWLWGELTGRPVLLIVTGAFADPGTLDHTGGVFPAVDVLRTHIPGNHCPNLVTTSVGVHAAALSDALRQATLETPLGVLGISLGALTALGIRSPRLRRLLLVEPPLFTADTWRLTDSLPASPGTPEAAFFWEVFGIRGREVAEPRDYSPLLAGLRVPAEVLLGDVPAMPRRSLETSPSFVGPAARTLLEAHPLVRTTVAPGAGHNVPVQGTMVLYEALVRMVADLTRPGG